MAVTTGANTWSAGTDVVVEGTAGRVLGLEVLERVAAAYVEKYGDAWSWQAGADGFHSGENLADHEGLVLVYRVVPAKVIRVRQGPARPDDVQVLSTGLGSARPPRSGWSSSERSERSVETCRTRRQPL